MLIYLSQPQINLVLAATPVLWLEQLHKSLAAPMQTAVIHMVDGIAFVWRRHFALSQTQAENEALRRENTQLLARLQDDIEVLAENKRLRHLIGLKTSANHLKLLFAEVIAISPSSLFRSLRLNRGNEEGVEVGAAVLTDEGLVGRIVNVTAHTADVMLLIDNNSSLDVLVQRTRVRARVRGQAVNFDDGLEVEFLDRIADIVPGDVLISGGLSKNFPKGLLVGQVVNTQQRAFGLYQQARVRPTVNFNQLEVVWVMQSPNHLTP